MARRRFGAWTVLALLALGAAWPTDAAPSLPCQPQSAMLLAERAGEAVIVDPARGTARESSISPAVAEQTARFRQRFGRLAFPRWQVARTADEQGRRFVVGARTGEIIFDITFANRIELAASASSTSGRFTIYVQSNNVASEVTVLDAGSGESRLVRISHDAPLAAWRIGIAFSPDEACAALSMERVGGPGAETWLVGLHTGEVAVVPVPNVFVLDWARTAAHTP